MAMLAPPDDLLTVIRAEFDCLPALRLTRPQFCRLWNLDPAECERVIGGLLAKGFLEEDEAGQLCRGRLRSEEGAVACRRHAVPLVA